MSCLMWMVEPMVFHNYPRIVVDVVAFGLGLVGGV